MPRITIDNFDRGLMKDFPLKGSETVYNKKGDLRHHNQVTLGGISPFPNPGYLVPGFQSTDVDSGDASQVTTKITSWAVKTAYGANTTYAAYGIGDNILYKVIGSGYTDIVNNSPTTPTWPHTIGSVTVVPGDIGDIVAEIQNIGGTQTHCLFYTYNSTAADGAGRMGRYDITADSNWGAGNSSDTAFTLTTNDVAEVSGSGIKSVPRPITVGTNKILYVANGYKVDSLDLTVSSASISLNALDIDQNYEIQSTDFWEGQLVMAAHPKSADTSGQRGSVCVFFWDTLSSTFSDPIYIDDDIAGALYVNNRNLYLFTANKVYGNLRLWDGRGFTSIQQVPTAIPTHHGVDNFRDGLVWGDSNGDAWWYGEAREGAGKWLWQFATVGTSLSCVRKLNSTGDVLHFTGQDTGSTEFIRSLNSSYATTETSLPVIDFPHRSTIKRIEAHFQTLASGASMSISFSKNLAGSATSYGGIVFADDGAVNRKVFNTRLTDVSQLGTTLAFASGSNTVKLERLIIDYDTPRTKLSS